MIITFKMFYQNFFFHRRRYSIETIVEYCLQALLSHSTLQSHCMRMLTTPCLPLFVKLVEEFPNNSRIKSIIGKILANMSLFPETHKALFSSGWVGILARWKQSPNLLVTLPATKALCNLDQVFTRQVNLQDRDNLKRNFKMTSC